MPAELLKDEADGVTMVKFLGKDQAASRLKAICSETPNQYHRSD
jgi:hypothetical protein